MKAGATTVGATMDGVTTAVGVTMDGVTMAGTMDGTMAGVSVVQLVLVAMDFHLL